MYTFKKTTKKLVKEAVAVTEQCNQGKTKQKNK